MAGLLGKKFPTPIARPLWPFFAAGAVILYGVNAAQVAMSNSAEYATHPANPAAGANAQKKNNGH
ncbi:hypothetical protein K461DRAFT_295719 [Myriangium duriaei CBS 260.36]|uniref:ATP synthase subunit J, mitochondrial n=1 Tax=Myriangium duriaei CBS 260.36 TaxID=1168546 RepID=A0A9P4IVJ0_9PEZI|nr:hypothetical protein K461DRAFT_295719 [Myriangium duriaei CBS 260.36]